ncbi:MAG: hypothetical protein AAB973_01510 [Patescibacteria group bacterium]
MKLFLSLLLVTSFFLISPTKVLADCLPFRGGGGAQLPVKCFTDTFKATCSTQEDCSALINGTVPTPAGSAYIPPGWTAPNTNPDSFNYCSTGSGEKGVNTALGCISFDAESGGFVRSLLGVIIGLGGGVALLLILYGVFIVTTSAGIPDKLNQGKEIISSAVAGLVFIILAIFLMNLIGVKILALPGL